MMNILIQIRETDTDIEIREFTEGDGNKVYISHKTEDSISHLNDHLIDKAIVSLKHIQDVAILKYLNDYYPAINVVVIANKTFDEIISIFQKVNYSVIHEPLQLSELKTQVTNKLKPA
jgi:hypothetical protein